MPAPPPRKRVPWFSAARVTDPAPLGPGYARDLVVYVRPAGGGRFEVYSGSGRTLRVLGAEDAKKALCSVKGVDGRVRKVTPEVQSLLQELVRLNRALDAI